MFIVVVSDVFPPPSAPAPMVARLYTGTLRDVHGKEEEEVEQVVASGSTRFSLPSSAHRRKQVFLKNFLFVSVVVVGHGPWKCLRFCERPNEVDAEKEEEEEEDRLVTTFAMA
jgi:hypothetical protein